MHERLFQSTRPRGARLGVRIVLHAHRAISIHAPAWGATIVPYLGDYVIQISIHAPAWGATNLQPGAGPMVLISIHAPAWGATFISQSVKEND